MMDSSTTKTNEMFQVIILGIVQLVTNSKIGGIRTFIKVREQFPKGSKYRGGNGIGLECRLVHTVQQHVDLFGIRLQASEQVK